MDLFSATLLTDLSAAEVAAQLAERGVEPSTSDTQRRGAGSWRTGATWCRRSGMRGWRPSPSTFGHGRGTRCPSWAAGCTGRPLRSCTPATGPARWPGNCSGRSCSPSTGSSPCWQGHATTTRRRRAGRRSHHCVLQPAAVHRQRAGLLRLPGGDPQPVRPRRRGVRAVQGAAAGLHRPDHRRRQPARPGRRPPGRPGARASRSACWPHWPTLPGLTLPDGTPVERAQGRTRTDWEELAAWYDATHGASGPEQLRGAAGQALGQLITNAKRLLDSSGTGFSRRADFLRLARWFAAADDEQAPPALRRRVRRLPGPAPAVRAGRARSADRAHDLLVARRAGARSRCRCANAGTGPCAAARPGCRTRPRTGCG